MSIFTARLRGQRVIATLTGGRVELPVVEVVQPPLTYDDARLEAQKACRNLGLLIGRHESDADREVGDLVRDAYVGGWKACETRLDSPDMADAISTAMETPAAVLEQLPGEPQHRWQVRAVQHVVAYGLAKR